MRTAVPRRRCARSRSKWIKKNQYIVNRLLTTPFLNLQAVQKGPGREEEGGRVRGDAPPSGRQARPTAGWRQGPIQGGRSAHEEGQASGRRQGEDQGPQEAIGNRRTPPAAGATSAWHRTLGLVRFFFINDSVRKMCLQIKTIKNIQKITTT